MPSVHASNFGTYISEFGNSSKGTIVRRSVRQFFNNMKKHHLGEVNKDLNMFYNKVLYSLVKDPSRLEQIAEDLFVAKYMLLYLNESIEYDTFSELPTIQNKLSELLSAFEHTRITNADLDTFEKGLDDIYGFINEIRDKEESLPVYVLITSLIEFYKKHVKQISIVAKGKPTQPPSEKNIQPVSIKLEHVEEKQGKWRANAESVISNGSRMTLRNKRKAFLNRLNTQKANNTAKSATKKGGRRTRKYRRSY